MSRFDPGQSAILDQLVADLKLDGRHPFIRRPERWENMLPGSSLPRTLTLEGEEILVGMNWSLKYRGMTFPNPSVPEQQVMATACLAELVQGGAWGANHLEIMISEGSTKLFNEPMKLIHFGGLWGGWYLFLPPKQMVNKQMTVTLTFPMYPPIFALLFEDPITELSRGVDVEVVFALGLKSYTS